MVYSLKDLNIKQIINYLRKSRQDIERERKTGEDTLSEMRTLMERVLNNYEITYTTKEEIGSGDKISTRPVFMEIIEELKQGKYQGIAVKEISRLGRGSYSDMGKIYDLIVEKRIYIITPWKIYDPANNSDLRQIRFEMFLSREEFETTRERLIGARYNYAMQGKWMAGSVPYGYHFNENTQRLEIFEDEAKIVRYIFNLYAYGLNNKRVGFRAISTHLNKSKIPSPKGNTHWHPMVVGRVILKPVYIGQASFRITKKQNGKSAIRPEEDWIIVNDAHEAIIDEITWIKSQEHYENRNKTPRNKMDFSPCELASLVTCAKCGGKMVRQYSVQNYTRKDGSKTQYHKEFLWCTIPGCTFVKYRDVEKQILKTLEQFSNLDNDKLEKIILESVNSKNKNDVNDDMFKVVLQRKKELENRLSFIFEKYESGVYSDEDFLNRKKKIEKEIAEISNSINTQQKIVVSEQKNDIVLDVDQLRKDVINVLNIYNESVDRSEKNKILHSIFEEIKITRTSYGKGRTPSAFDLDVRFNGDFFGTII